MKLQSFSAILPMLLQATSAKRPGEVLYRPEQARTAALKKRLEPQQHRSTSIVPRQADRFHTAKTEKFIVNGTGLPDVNFDVGESYAGLLPISNDTNETLELFFWFFPSIHDSHSQEITVWFNGGPGCSSLLGFLQENGPFSWIDGTEKPVPNPYSWHNLTNMLWVEQPVGVGFTQGTPNITNEEQLAQQFTGFYKQFVETFDVQGWGLYLTGESYAGFYVPYIADAFLNISDPDISLKGISINDPIIGDSILQQAVVVQPFVEYWSNVLGLNTTFLSYLSQQHQTCNYSSYLSKYFTFPPPQEPFPTFPNPATDETDCSALLGIVQNASLLVNPCFNVYHISDGCPIPSGPLDAPNAWFNRTEVQKAINAPVGTNWSTCATVNVFGGPSNNESLSDTSLGPAQNDVLRRVIEATNNVIIGSGNLDILLSTNGTLLALQNTTWNGRQGFERYPSEEFHVPFLEGADAGGGILGTWGCERGLTFYEVQLAGHELPRYAPGAAYRMMELLLGRIGSLSERGEFTTVIGKVEGKPGE